MDDVYTFDFRVCWVVWREVSIGSDRHEEEIATRWCGRREFCTNEWMKITTFHKIRGSHLPVEHVIVLTAPAPEHVRKTVDQSEVLRAEVDGASNQFRVLQPASRFKLMKTGRKFVTSDFLTCSWRRPRRKQDGGRWKQDTSTSCDRLPEVRPRHERWRNRSGNPACEPPKTRRS